MKFICFGSGSSGNCYYLQAADYGIIIDAGIGVRQFKKYFRDYGLSLTRIKAMLITHDHADHVKASGAISNELGIPVYATSLVHQGIKRNYCITKKVDERRVRNFEKGETFELGPFRILPFNVPHDSLDNSGYFITYRGRSFCLMTDAGHVTDEMAGFMEKADYLVVEANYDETMLQHGPYPPFLKERIACGTGHLSNSETARQLAAHLNREARHVWLCHLSEENNHPSLAFKTVEAELRQAGYPVGATLQLETLRRQSPSPLYDLDEPCDENPAEDSHQPVIA